MGGRKQESVSRREGMERGQGPKSMTQAVVWEHASRTGNFEELM
jgi:hypothetical protein